MKKNSALKYTTKELRAISLKNIAENINWETVDILITTPMQLQQIIEIKEKRKEIDIKPRYIVFDEMDIIIE